MTTPEPSGFTFDSPLAWTFGRPFFLAGPMYIFSFKNLSDSVTGVDDTLGGFFGLFFALARF